MSSNMSNNKNGKSAQAKKRLSEHFTLAEMAKTTVKGADNTPTAEAEANLRNLCENWLEDLRFTYNGLYCLKPGEDYATSKAVEGIVINSGYRSPAVNKAVGGAKGSNHLTGCAVDLKCLSPEQLLRYATILLDQADDTNRDFDELILERRGSRYWLHFAVRPEGNRRKVVFDIK